MLPAAVRRSADRAAELIKGGPAAATPAAASAAATPPAPAKSADVVELEKKLAAEEALRKAAEDRAKAADGIAKANGQELKAAREALKKAEDERKAAEEAAKKRLEKLDITGLSADERKLAGDDMVTIVAKTAREVAELVVAEKMKPVTERFDALVSMSDESYGLVLDEIPNFESVNDDPKFMAWLNQNDPRTGRLRLDRIKRAEALRQGYLVKEIFAAFVEGREIGVPKAEAPKPPVKGPEAQVDAGTGGGNAVDLSVDKDGKRIWTGTQITQHYREKTAGLWRGKEAEWRKLEEDIFAARREGRVKG